MSTIMADQITPNLLWHSNGSDPDLSYESPVDWYWEGSPPTNYSCDYRYYNQSSKKIITSAYEGIPENLLLNFIGWLILLMLFSVLRKKAWNYGRIALVQKTKERWTHLFYGTVEGESSASEADALNTPDSIIQKDKGFCSWLTAIFTIKDESILQKCGHDAIQYLSFQRYIMLYISIVTVISLTVVLPINFQGTLEGDETTFGHTTLHNLDPNSSFLWIHVTLAILYFPLGIIIMRRFSVTMKFEDKNTSTSRTLMITNIPTQECETGDIYRHFSEAYPEIEIQDVQFAYNITKLSKLDKKRDNVYQAKLYCESYLLDHGVRLEMKPYIFGNMICGCCDVCGCPKVDAIEYYTEEEARLRNLVDTERIQALKKPLGIAFVTLSSLEAAQRVYTDHIPSCKCSNNPPTSSISRRLESYDWRVQFAPAPNDIYWENLALASNYWYLKALFINLFLFVVLFFLTTPVIVVNFLDSIMVAHELQKLSPVISEFLPTLLLWTMAALMPVLVSYSDQWLSHWTRSEQNHSIMIKTFIFLLFMVLILPSLGLTSAQTFLDWTLHNAIKNQTYRWECIFLPDKGAFFVNYVTTSAFIGTSLELIRFPELFMYVCRLALARSPAETSNVRSAILWEFSFGVQYAWMLLIFAMTTMYSLSCPLITPFGLLYMVMKHLVDRYNIYFAYSPSKISSHIHATAINAVIVSITLLQLSFTALAILRRGFNDIAIYSIVGLCITCAFLIAQVMFQSCRGCSPISYQRQRNSSFASSLQVVQRDMFVPSVLQTPTHYHERNGIGDQSVEERPASMRRSYGTRDHLETTTDDSAMLYQDYDDSNIEA